VKLLQHGPRGEHLSLYPFLLTSWGEWHRLHPDTLVLKPMPGCLDRLAEENGLIKEGLSGKGQAPAGVLRTGNRLAPKAMVLGLDVEGSNKAYPLKELQKARVARMCAQIDQLLGLTIGSLELQRLLVHSRQKRRRRV